MTAAVLALQGAFAEHERILARLGVPCVELRQKSDLEKPFDALILPGGESTAQGKLLRELGMLGGIRERILGGTKTLATCAGMILLAEKIENDARVHLATMPIRVRRNAYGRQLGSFFIEEEFLGIGKIPMTFIRAPYIESAGEGAQVLAETGGKIVAAKFQNQTALSFHPELNADARLHEWWLAEA